MSDLDEVIAHLGAALMQAIDSDDQIIMNHVREAERFAKKLRGAPRCEVQSGDDWREDPAQDERWNAGLDFAMMRLCGFLGVDPKAVNWDAATETLDGDVSAVIGNILREKYGEDWWPEDAAQAVPDSYRETVRKVAATREKGYAAARANLQEAWAALAMIRETVEALAPSGSVKAAEHLDGPTFMHEAEALVAGILAMPSANAAQEAWMDIETAPKDRKRILLYQAGRGAFEGWWHTAWPHPEEYWMDDADSEPNPTHWRPTLALPSATRDTP